MSSDNSKSALEGISGAFIALCTITVGLRFIARRRQSSEYGIDDWCMLAALPFVVGYLACVIALVHIGWIGWGTYPFPASELPTVFHRAIKVVIASDIVLHIALALTKASAILLYRRIFVTGSSGFEKRFEYVLFGTLAVILAWMITFSFLAGFQCGPDHLLDAWDKTSNKEYCGIANVYAYGFFVSDIVLDVWVICLPIPSILRLHAMPSRKFYVAGIFGVALVGVAASIVRLANYLEVAILGTVKLSRTEGEVLASKLIFYNALELGMITVSINIPVLWSLFTNHVPDALVRVARSIRSLSSGGSRGSHNSRSSSHPRSNHETRRGSSVADMDKLYDTSRGTSEAYAMHDMSVPPLPEGPKAHIMVNESFHVSSSDEPRQAEMHDHV